MAAVTGRRVHITALALALAACGGGGGGGSDFAPTPTVGIADAAVTEGNSGTTTLDFTVTLDAASGMDATVSYATADGTASSGSDYVAASGTVTIAAGETSAQVSVQVQGDTAPENDETFVVNLSSAANARIADGQATGTITDDDSIRVSIADASIAEGNSGTKALTFTATLSDTPGGTVTAAYSAAPGTATAGTDYAAASGTVVFPAGSTSQPVVVNVVGDLLDEPDETFQVELTNPTGGALIGDGSAIGTILDDDAEPSVSIADAAVTEGNAGSKALAFTVSLSAASGRSVDVTYATAAGSATPGSDFTAASGAVNFTPGQVTAQVTVNILGDGVVEPDEDFAVTLSAPVNATLGSAQATGTIVNDDVASEFGLDARPGNATCITPPRPTGGAGVETVLVNDYGSAYDEPTKILQAPGDSTHWYVLEKSGRVFRFDAAAPATRSTYLDLRSKVASSGEGGLLGLAFHPDFPDTQEVFVSYTAPGSGGYAMVSRISRLQLDGTTTPPEQVLLTLDQPSVYHKGGDIAFGPDGYLYVAFGDAATPLADRDAQDTTSLLGAMVRINVLGVAFPNPAYTIPADNPFAANAKCTGGYGAEACPEIWAWGFRNPWRWSFDRQGGRLWLGDVGETHYEEIDIVEKGKNYGWPEREGRHCTPELYPGGTGCQTAGLTDPVLEYPHDASGNIAVVGGWVYRGNAIPTLKDRYLFGDYNTGQIWTAEPDGSGGYLLNELFLEGHLISAYAIGEDGEFYMADIGNGLVRKLVAKTDGGVPDEIPDNLVDTGCVDPGDPSQPAPGMIPYDINAPFWSDGAQKERWLALPDGATISVDATTGDWDLPPGSIIMKLFRLNGAPVETRLLMRHPDGEWRGYTWAWSGGVATRVRNGLTTSIGGQQWTYPSEAQCLRCHTNAAGFSLGPETAQLNRDLTYPGTGRTANQLATLEHIGMFSAAIGDPAALPALPDPADTGQPLAARARAWLHTNCSQCHRPGGPTPSTMDLRYTTPVSAMGACNVNPASGGLGLTNPKLIKPGDAANSLVRERMSRRDSLGMPPLATAIADSAGVALVTDWINSLPDCN